MNVKDIEAKLGWRVGPMGVELLSFDTDGKAEVRAVNPVMDLGKMLRLWELISEESDPMPENYKAQLDVMHTTVQRLQAEVEHWKQQAFKEHESLVTRDQMITELQAQLVAARQMGSVDAYAVKDSFGTKFADGTD